MKKKKKIKKHKKISKEIKNLVIARLEQMPDNFRVSIG